MTTVKETPIQPPTTPPDEPFEMEYKLADGRIAEVFAVGYSMWNPFGGACTAMASCNNWIFGVQIKSETDRSPDGRSDVRYFVQGDGVSFDVNRFEVQRSLDSAVDRGIGIFKGAVENDRLGRTRKSMNQKKED